MRRKNRLIRLFRALSEKTQKDFSTSTGVHPSALAQLELGVYEPADVHLERAAKEVGLTVASGELILDFADKLREPVQRSGLGGQPLAEVGALLADLHDRVVRLPGLHAYPKAEDRRRAAELWADLAKLPPEVQLSVVDVATEYQSWAVAERACQESVELASRNLEHAAFLARLAGEIAARYRGPAGFCRRLLGYVAAHGPNVLRVAGDLDAAEAGLEEARRSWDAGADPDSLLDPGRLLDLEASLRRGQRRFDEALALLDQALPISHAPGRILVNRAFTLEVMGDYEGAVLALLQAEPRLDREAHPRLWYQQRFNLAVCYSHLGRHRDAAELVAEVKSLASSLGDDIFLIRATGLEGRIAAGLGRRDEALALLNSARQRFAERKMGYDVALMTLELAVLLLEAGDTGTVKKLAEELQQAFEANGVHREALAAVRLFHEAVALETATADLAQRVLRFLFRARHDEELRFGE